jgi:uncharacterized protein (DUF1330 family)
MAAYLVATVRITDPARFSAYLQAIAGLSEKFGGESIVKGSVDGLLEGDAPAGERIVVSRFPDADAVRCYIGSPEYQHGKALREGAAEVTMRLVVDPAR